jgi:hypothetical protein
MGMGRRMRFIVRSIRMHEVHEGLIEMGWERKHKENEPLGQTQTSVHECLVKMENSNHLWFFDPLKQQNEIEFIG